MAIPIGDLRSAAKRAGLQSASKSLTEARARQEHVAFLCHSHKDEELALGLQALLRESGWNLYIDWQDTQMPDKPNRTTAEKLQARIRSSDYFLFLATGNSTASRWCPWELGYADGARPYERILIVPTTDDMGHLHGSEYLELYQHIDGSTLGKLAAYPAGQRTGVLVSSLR